jgi:hypothetical protein
MENAQSGQGHSQQPSELDAKPQSARLPGIQELELHLRNIHCKFLDVGI